MLEGLPQVTLPQLDAPDLEVEERALWRRRNRSLVRRSSRPVPSGVGRLPRQRHLFLHPVKSEELHAPTQGGESRIGHKRRVETAERLFHAVGPEKRFSAPDQRRHIRWDPAQRSIKLDDGLLEVATREPHEPHSSFRRVEGRLFVEGGLKSTLGAAEVPRLEKQPGGLMKHRRRRVHEVCRNRWKQVIRVPRWHDDGERDHGCTPRQPGERQPRRQTRHASSEQSHRERVYALPIAVASKRLSRRPGISASIDTCPFTVRCRSTRPCR